MNLVITNTVQDHWPAEVLIGLNIWYVLQDKHVTSNDKYRVLIGILDPLWVWQTLHRGNRTESQISGVHVYWIPCECGKLYIGETGRNLPTRLKEHRAHGRKGDFEKSSNIKHSHIKDHQIDWRAAQLITLINSWHTRRIREAIKIFKHNTVPQDIGFFITVTFGDPYYGLKDLQNAKSTTQTEGSPTSQVNHPPSPCAC